MKDSIIFLLALSFIFQVSNCSLDLFQIREKVSLQQIDTPCENDSQCNKSVCLVNGNHTCMRCNESAFNLITGVNNTRKCEGVYCLRHSECLLNFCFYDKNSNQTYCSAKNRMDQIDDLIKIYIYCGIGFVGAFVAWIVFQCYRSKRRLQLMAEEEEDEAMKESLKDD